METLKKSVLLLFLFPCCALAQVQTIVTGTVQTPTGVVATKGYVEFRISPASSSIAYRVPGTTIIAPQVSRCNISATGQVVSLTGGACQVWGNTTIQPASTCYNVVIAPNNTPSSTIQQQQITGTSYDLSRPVFCPNVAIVPQYQTITTAPINANLVPAANKTLNLGDSGHYYASAYVDNLFANNLNSVSSLTVGTLQSANITNSSSITTTNLTVTGVFNGPASSPVFPTLTDNTLPVVQSGTKGLRDSDISEDDTGGPGLSLVKINARLIINGTTSDFNGTGSTVNLGGFVIANSPTNAQTLRLVTLGGGGGGVFDSSHTGSATTKPFFWTFDNGTGCTTSGFGCMKLTTDGVLELQQSYTGSNLSDAGTVAFRNNAGVLEVSQNAGAWGAIGAGGGLSGTCATTNGVTKFNNSTTLGCSTKVIDGGANFTVSGERTFLDNGAGATPLSVNSTGAQTIIELQSGGATSAQLVTKNYSVGTSEVDLLAAAAQDYLHITHTGNSISTASGDGLDINVTSGTTTVLKLLNTGTNVGELFGFTTGPGGLELLGGTFLQITNTTANFGFGSASYANMVGGIALAVAVTAPTTNPPAGTMLFYIDPADGGFKARTSGGNVRVIAAQ